MSEAQEAEGAPEGWRWPLCRERKLTAAAAAAADCAQCDEADVGAGGDADADLNRASENVDERVAPGCGYKHSMN